jgi:GNAT superfamily N-acetyltransferase
LPDFVLRRAARPDVPLVVGVVNRAYRVEDAFVAGDRMTVSAAEAALAGPDRAIVVAEAPGPTGARIAGAVFIEVRGARGYFGPLAVDPDFQGRGLGRRLVEAAADYCRDRGCRQLDLDVLDVRPELLSVYGALGFLSTGTSAYPYPDRLRRPAHLILMSRPL